MFLLCTLFCLYRPMKIKVAMATKIAERIPKAYESQYNSKTIHTSLMKLNMCTGGKVITIHMICFCCRMKSMDTMVTKIVKIL